ncbi:hypothetical protein [Olsenella sp. Marseille-P4559]|uniref:hypothetical protein n=1 Tax=Olsenella sp. Marseille-P4559 TaxID=2364795 RepID=UPI0010303F15|nr:hypothetical protein [Olsenella sp. Marseille-P4559]
MDWATTVDRDYEAARIRGSLCVDGELQEAGVLELFESSGLSNAEIAALGLPYSDLVVRSMGGDTGAPNAFLNLGYGESGRSGLQGYQGVYSVTVTHSALPGFIRAAESWGDSSGLPAGTSSNIINACDATGAATGTYYATYDANASTNADNMVSYMAESQIKDPVEEGVKETAVSFLSSVTGLPVDTDGAGLAGKAFDWGVEFYEKSAGATGAAKLPYAAVTATMDGVIKGYQVTQDNRIYGTIGSAAQLSAYATDAFQGSGGVPCSSGNGVAVLAGCRTPGEAQEYADHLSRYKACLEHEDGSKSHEGWLDEQKEIRGLSSEGDGNGTASRVRDAQAGASAGATQAGMTCPASRVRDAQAGAAPAAYTHLTQPTDARGELPRGEVSVMDDTQTVIKVSG